jgi:hypothetical protein
MDTKCHILPCGKINCHPILFSVPLETDENLRMVFNKRCCETRINAKHSYFTSTFQGLILGAVLLSGTTRFLEGQVSTVD